MKTRALALVILAALLGGARGPRPFRTLTPAPPRKPTPPFPGRPERDRAGGFWRGGVYATSVINGPSLERARGRGVKLPEPGFAAAVGVYPGGCFSLVKQLVVRPLLVLIGEAD